MGVGELDGVERFGERTDLVHLDEDGVGTAFVDAALEELDVGDEQVVADDLDAIAEGVVELLPAGPVVFVEAVLDGVDGVVLDEGRVELDHLVGVFLAALGLEHVETLVFVVEAAGGRVEGDEDVLARLIAGLLNGFHDDLEGFFVGGEVGGEAAFVAHAGGQAAVAEHLLERVEHLGAHPQGLAEVGRAEGLDHELLDVHVVVRVGAAVQDVHHRHGQDAGAHAADVAVERQVEGVGRGAGDGERHAEDGVGAQVALVGRAVELAEQLVDAHLVGGVEALDLGGDDLVHVGHGLGGSLAAVAGGLAVAKLDGLILAGGGARGHVGAADGAGFELDFHLDGGVAAGVEDFSGVGAHDRRHGFSPFQERVNAN